MLDPCFHIQLLSSGERADFPIPPLLNCLNGIRDILMLFHEECTLNINMELHQSGCSLAGEHF